MKKIKEKGSFFLIFLMRVFGSTDVLFLFKRFFILFTKNVTQKPFDTGFQKDIKKKINVCSMQTFNYRIASGFSTGVGI